MEMTHKQAAKHGYELFATTPSGIQLFVSRSGRWNSLYEPQREYLQVAISGGLGVSEKKVSDWGAPDISAQGCFGDRDSSPSLYYTSWPSGGGSAAYVAQYIEIMQHVCAYVEQLNAENEAEWAEHGAGWMRLRKEWDMAEARQRDRDFAATISERIGRPLRRGDRIAIGSGGTRQKYSRYTLYEATNSKRLTERGNEKHMYKAEAWVSEGTQPEGFLIRSSGGAVSKIKQQPALSPF